MQNNNWQEITKARDAALEVLRHNAAGPFGGLPSAAAWGYPEPYTRDLMLSLLGIAANGDYQLLQTMRRVLETLAENQSERGHIPSLVHDKEDRGASDTTPLFLLAVAIFRKVTREKEFLQDAVSKAMKWMEYQSPSDEYLIAQQPTSDWRDEQWVLGYGLFVNTVVYSYLRLYGLNEKADKFRAEMEDRLGLSGHDNNERMAEKPYYAFWCYKVYKSERFDLLGNSIAILSGLASQARAEAIISWIEEECSSMRKKGVLAPDVPPNFFPYIQPEDPDWIPRYDLFNRPGEYHNGGIWPFVCSLYIAALVAAKKYEPALEKLTALTALIRTGKNNSLDFGFNEWYRAQDGMPCGEDWQTWSAALYLYAVKCVGEKKAIFFDDI